MVADRFGKKYFEQDATYAKSILKGRRPLYHRFWVRYIRKHEENGQLLDIGCGKGFFLAYAERFFEAYGVDVSLYALKKTAQMLHRPRLCVQEATQLGFKNRYFHVVTYFDILEHIEQPELAIKECNRGLKEGGLFIISVPNRYSYGLN